MKKLIAFLLLGFISFSAFANHSLLEERMTTVKNYLNNLQTRNAAAMADLFVENGTVISTSKGKLSAVEFFNSFLPELTFSSVSNSQIYLAANDPDHLMAEFHFNYKLKDGEEGGGDYVDDFAFAKNSNKLSNVHMFENLKG